MEDSRRRQLLAVSADFYRQHAGSFSESRQGSWDSWDRVWTVAQQGNPSTVLDVGCGNGRFRQFLNDHDGAELTYTGVDAEPGLIDLARHRHERDQFVVATVDGVVGWPNPFDLVVSFGVFHHLPGVDYRVRTLQGLAGRLSPTGLLVISLWQPKLLANFSAKLCPDANTGGLEANDYLLSWKGDCSKPRYCHHFDDDEISGLIDRSSLDLVEQFQGTGNDQSNRYLILTKP